MGKIQDYTKITEKQFESQVKSLAKTFGWRYYHTWRSIHSEKGFPDCVMVRPPRLIFAELKRTGGKLTTYQEEWIEDFKSCRQEIQLQPKVDFNAKPNVPLKIVKLPIITMPEVYIWFPDDIDDIIKILRGDN